MKVLMSVINVLMPDEQTVARAENDVPQIKDTLPGGSGCPYFEIHSQIHQYTNVPETEKRPNKVSHEDFTTTKIHKSQMSKL
jgi:hypothetical protein